LNAPKAYAITTKATVPYLRILTKNLSRDWTIGFQVFKANFYLPLIYSQYFLSYLGVEINTLMVQGHFYHFFDLVLRIKYYLSFETCLLTLFLAFWLSSPFSPQIRRKLKETHKWIFFVASFAFE
jgi:hypothetical protein